MLLDQAFSAADQLLYRAKQRGRDRVVMGRVEHGEWGLRSGRPGAEGTGDGVS